MPLREQIITLVFLLGFSAFFSGAETALVSISKLRAKHLAEKRGGRINKTLKNLKDSPQRMLTTILIGNNIVNIAAASLATSITMQFFENYAIGIATGVMTLLILVFGEITPKTLAMHYSEGYAKVVSLPIWYLSIILYPFILLFDGFYKILTRKIKPRKNHQTVSEDYLKGIVTASQEEGSIKPMEKEMVHKIFEFDDTNASEVMTPKTDMFLLDSEMKVKEALDIALKNPYSRIPIYKEAIDKINGIVFLRDIIKEVQAKKDSTLEKISHKPYFVPEIKKIDSLLRQFQKKKEHMAIVVDEHGMITGLVTMEDILEEIVGEIMDETDKRDPMIKKIKNKQWLVKGKADIDEINNKLKINIEESEEYDTLGGFILSKTGKIPAKGEKVQHHKINMIIEDVDNHRIIRVKVIKK